MISPSNGSTFNSTTVNFKWKDTGASEYFLIVGTKVGARDLYASSQKTRTTKSVTNLPNNGVKLYVRLYTKIDGKWQHNDYVYTSYTKMSEIATARMITPLNEATLDNVAYFKWEDTGASLYDIYVGTSEGAADLYNAEDGNYTEYQLSGFSSLEPGTTIYFRLWTFNGEYWTYNDYVYVTSGR